MKAKTGTREWSDTSLNFGRGCAHGCRYCYARAQLARFKRLSLAEADERFNRTPMVYDGTSLQFNRSYPGVVMFPTMHDIQPGEQAEAACRLLPILLRRGNHILIVLKAHREVVTELCRALAEWRAQVEFRITITALNEKLRAWWEPGAPPYAERLDALWIARKKGYRTSVAAEPMLDPGNAWALVQMCAPEATEGVWLGLLNRAKSRVLIRPDEDREAEWAQHVAPLLAAQAPEKIRELYEKLKGNPMVRWKDSIRKVVGL
jgi:DNA repair photolyase